MCYPLIAQLFYRPEVMTMATSTKVATQLRLQLFHATRCPDCGGPLVHGEGCASCPVCGYSHCGN